MKAEMVLQITSMADIFTILLVFLLKSFSTGVSSITPSNDVTLPLAESKDQVEEMLKVEISPSGITVDDKPATTLAAFKFDPKDQESDGTLRSLNSTLIAMKAQRNPASSGMPADPATASDPGAQYKPLMILADEKTPYSLIRSVMSSAENSGFVQYKLVVVEDK
jgi:biopolymer transport protein ExbD